MPIIIERLPERPKRTIESIAQQEAVRVFNNMKKNEPAQLSPVIITAPTVKPGSITLVTNPGAGTVPFQTTSASLVATFSGGDIVVLLEGVLAWSLNAAPGSSSHLSCTLLPVIDGTTVTPQPQYPLYLIEPCTKSGAVCMKRTMILRTTDVSTNILRGGTHSVAMQISGQCVALGNGTVSFREGAITIYRAEGMKEVKNS